MKRFLALTALGALVMNATANAAGNDTKRALVPPPPAIPIAAPSAARSAVPAAVTKAPAVDLSRAVVVGTGGPFVLTGKGTEQFTGTFSWKPASPSDPLTMQVMTSFTDKSSPQVRWMRIFLGNRLLGTEKDFRGNDVLTLDLTGSVGSGLNQVVIQTAGDRGASIKWTASSVLSAKMKSVEPDEVVVGESITVKGENFPVDPTNTFVLMGKKALPIKSATATELKLVIPHNLEPDDYTVNVQINNKKLPGSAKLTVRGIPRLISTNITGCPPGYPLVITGKNFSKKASENQVWIGQAQAQVQSATTDQLTVICPSEGSNFYDGGHGPMELQTYLNIKLKVGKIECKDTLPIVVGNSVWHDPGLQGPVDVPVDVRNNF